ncbi:MAG: hypothetical protein KR126chlam5_01433 [Candidatus Anoxychlamydiales bacterium]|nr:hypothetical protein [Candidatus Anoxychlamydiales bacterium]
MFTIYSIIPSLQNHEGHQYEYNIAFTKAALINGWKYIKIIPRKCSIDNLESDWQKSIFGMETKNKIKNLKNFIPFLKVFRKIKKTKNSVLFAEDFTIITLFLFFICIFLLRPKMQLWLLFRFEHDVMIKKGKPYAYILHLIEFILGKKNIKYLTDSELVAKRNGSFFKRNFNVLPIPHTNNSIISRSILKKDHLSFWWPGGLTRKEKGLFRIQRLANLLKDAEERVILEVAKSAQSTISSNNNVNFLPIDLPRKEYNEKMLSTDLILLPYLENSYGYRTSGIFVEAIVAGITPAISKDTWMANELKKYDLEELIVDWESADLIKTLTSICANKKIKEKILLMRRKYLDIHNVDNFAKKLKDISL